MATTQMQSSNRLWTAFKEGRQSMGMWQMIPGANVSRALASTGVDWILVDCEHGMMDGRSEIEARVALQPLMQAT